MDGHVLSLCTSFPRGMGLFWMGPSVGPPEPSLWAPGLGLGGGPRRYAGWPGPPGLCGAAGRLPRIPVCHRFVSLFRGFDVAMFVRF